MDKKARHLLRAALVDKFPNLTVADCDRFIDLMVVVDDLREDRGEGEPDPK